MEDLIKPILDLFCSCLGQEIDHRADLERNVAALRREMAELREMRDGVQEKVTLLERRTPLRRTEAVGQWLVDVENLDEDVEDIEEAFRRGREPLARRWHAPRRWWETWKLSRKVAAKLSELRYLKRSGDFKEVVEKPRPEPSAPRRRRNVGDEDPAKKGE